ncbi:hypothetical protein MES5069_960001 [Mesorhizobium escarrei]|uniref:Uncharacterized protein n=1 Tax=Mesorhizobium escarrei TaxID=666018 RepID=A0ABM9EJV1_9HYPH|nr:hypothetical protein MES5069_960001 [Mesorhizobium escarrei]
MSGRPEGGASLRHQRFCTVVTLRSNGMDPRVYAASHRSLLRPRMTKARRLTANRRRWRLADAGRRDSAP